MKYLGLAYFTPEKFAALRPDEIEALVSQCPARDEQMRATGKVMMAASLGDLGCRARADLADFHRGREISDPV